MIHVVSHFEAGASVVRVHFAHVSLSADPSGFMNGVNSPSDHLVTALVKCRGGGTETTGCGECGIHSSLLGAHKAGANEQPS